MPAAQRPVTQAVEVQIDHRRGVEGQQLAADQATDDGNAQRTAQLSIAADTEQQRQGAEQGRQAGHHDRPKTHDAGLQNRLARAHTEVTLGIQGEVDHQDGVLLDDADQQNDADQRDQRQLGAAQQQGQQGADPSRGQRRDDRQRVHIALVENAEDDINRQQGRQNHQRHVVLGGLGRTGIAGKAGLHRHGQVQRLQSGEDAGLGGGQGYIRGQIEAKGGGGELPLVVDRQRRVARLDAGEHRQRHPRAVGGDHIHLLENFRAALVRLAHFHHHPVLIERVVDGRHLALAEGVVQHRTDHLDIDAIAGGRLAVYHQAALQAFVLLIAVDVLELRQLSQRRFDPWCGGA